MPKSPSSVRDTLEVFLAFLAGLAFWPFVVCEGVVELLRWIFG